MQTFNNLLIELRNLLIFETIDERATSKRIIGSTLKVTNYDFNHLMRLKRKYKFFINITTDNVLDVKVTIQL